MTVFSVGVLDKIMVGGGACSFTAACSERAIQMLWGHHIYSLC